ncbi:phage tail assembly chaperone [Hyphomicrobium sp. 99]|uniref:phage tail assembly chaperone n=1 Tax=Hyphomicrobium sp. 99 TaxID=1163419 RepID=UPI0005F834B6|nr:phage tail assembly chaperone [Hyphomicrobium sp. 99]
MELGLGALGMMPCAFWSLTPRELQAALAGKFGATGETAAPTRRDLDTLMQRFPDEGSTDGNE